MQSRFNAGRELQVNWRWNKRPIRIRVERLSNGWKITWQQWYRIRGGGRHSPPQLGYWHDWRSYSGTGVLRDVVRRYREYADGWRGLD